MITKGIKVTIGIGIVAILALAAGFYFGSSRVATPSAGTEDILSNFMFTDLQGHPTTLSNWQGKPRIVNFWATWCAPCRAEMPLLSRFQTAHADELQILGVAVDTPEQVAKFQHQVQIVFPILLGDANTLDLMRKLGNTSGGLPFSLFLDSKGKVVGAHLGALTPESLDQALIVLK